MNISANGFNFVPLNSIGRFLRGRGVSKSDVVEAGVGVVLYGELYTKFDGVIKRPESFVDESVAEGSELLKYGDILFPTAGESADEIGKPSVYLSTERACAGGDIIIFRPSEPKLADFLVSALRTHAAFEYRYRMGQGQSIVHVSQEALEKHPVLAVDLASAERIAEIRSTWDRAIDFTQKIIAAKRQRKHAILQQFVDRPCEKWPSIKLGELLKNRSAKGRPGLPTYSVTMDSGLVPRDSLDRKNDTTLEPEQHLLIEEGDIAYNMMRMWQGASGLATEAGLVSPAYVVIRSRGKVDPTFASYWFKMPRVVKKFQDYSHGLTKDRLRLYYKDFATIALPLPPLKFQQQIAKAMQCCDRELDLLERKVLFLKQQKEGLMQQLLTGKTRVKLSKGTE